MKKSINTPYQRKSGIEITAGSPYVTQGDNRRERRKKEPPFISNGKNYPLTVIGNYKYLRHIQVMPDGKKINHYLG